MMANKKAEWPGRGHVIETGAKEDPVSGIRG